MWRVRLNGTDITPLVSGVNVSCAAGDICAACTIELADRAVLAGLVLPRVPQTLSLAITDSQGVDRGEYYLETIDYPQNLDARTATLWGRTASARLSQPWAPKISKQWAAQTSIAAIVAELSELCGVSVAVANDYQVCQYCYAVSGQTPAERSSAT